MWGRFSQRMTYERLRESMGKRRELLDNRYTEKVKWEPPTSEPNKNVTVENIRTHVAWKKGDDLSGDGGRVMGEKKGWKR